MNMMEQWADKWNELSQKAQPGLTTAGEICKKTGSTISLIGTWIWRA